MMKNNRRLLFFIGLFSLFLCFFPQALVLGETLSEYEIKSAFLYNFANFVEWPELQMSSKTEMVIGTCGNEEMFQVLKENFEGKSLRNWVIQIQSVDHVDQALSCDVLFISEQSSRSQSFLESLKDKSILTVGDSPDFLKQGGIIAFFPDNGTESILRPFLYKT